MIQAIKKKITEFLHQVIEQYQINKQKRELKYIEDNLKKVGENLAIEFPAKINGLSQITIGDNFIAGSNLRLDAFSIYKQQKYNAQIIIGNNVSVEQFCHIGAVDEVRIDDGVLIASKVFITDHSHGSTDFDAAEWMLAPAERQLVSKGKVHIKRNVWIGENVVILSGVTIGEGAIIGANAVVSKSIPDFAIAVGVPAKVVKQMK